MTYQTVSTDRTGHESIQAGLTKDQAMENLNEAIGRVAILSLYVYDSNGEYVHGTENF